MKKEKKIIEEGVRTVLHSIKPEIIEFINKPNDIFKKMEYNSTYKSAITYHCDIFETATFIYYGETTYMLKCFKDNYILRSSKKRGFSYNKDTKKLFIWFGGNVDIAITYIQYTYKWVVDYLKPYLTKSIIEKIMSGKIKSPTELCKYYLKVNRIKFSPKIFYRIISQFNIEKNYLLKIIYLANSDDLAVYNYIKNHLSNNNDDKTPFPHLSYDEFELFNKKINYNWSANRINKENKKLSDDYTNLKLLDNKENNIIGLESIYNDSDIKLPPNSIWVKDENHLRSLYIKFNKHFNKECDKNRLFIEIDNLCLVELCYNASKNKISISDTKLQAKKQKDNSYTLYTEMFTAFLEKYYDQLLAHFTESTSTTTRYSYNIDKNAYIEQKQNIVNQPLIKYCPDNADEFNFI